MNPRVQNAWNARICPSVVRETPPLFNFSSHKLNQLQLLQRNTPTDNIWANTSGKKLRNTVLESEKYSLQNQEVHPQDSLLLALLYYYLANFSWRWRYCRKIDPQDTLLGFSFAGQLRIGGLPKNFQPLHISKYLLPNMTLLLWLNVPSCCLSNLPVVLTHTCKLDSVTVWQKNQFYIPMQGLHCSSLTKHPHIYIQGVLFHWYPPKKLKYGKPGSTWIYVDVARPRFQENIHTIGSTDHQVQLLNGFAIFHTPLGTHEVWKIAKPFKSCTQHSV